MEFSRKGVLAAVAVGLLSVSVAAAAAYGQSRGRAGASGLRGRSSLPATGRTSSPRATVIPNRSGGFDMYSPRGHSRYLGESQGNKVFHPDGSSSIVVPDGRGGATVYGPQGTQRIFPEDANSE